MTTICFSVDVEGFVEANAESFAMPPGCMDRGRQDDEVRRNMAATLEFLADLGVAGTFFFLGRMARDLPALVRDTAAAGHEIGCHSYEHLRVYGVPPDEFRERLGDAKRRLEDVSGRPVHGFRAPDFSITKASLWALDILQSLGFTYDSSISPTGLHDVYGIDDAQPVIHRLPNGLLEFPPSTFAFLGRRIPFAGGGYFRHFPIAVTRHLIRRAGANAQPCMFYIHPYEVGPVLPVIPGMSAYRRWRHCHNCANGRERMRALLAGFGFSTVHDALRTWEDGRKAETACATT